ncbi:hypothetical protein Clacol_006204 [Clathrus columnatus]|uniref:Uncharacterized protein n=1 Tax=Clathrus columnatus TaxID=1419009 RepID=A0AAV5AG80_9AGAM|nr:hypothetical protein Clacol_006204 [Clathrus columnatus]
MSGMRYGLGVPPRNSSGPSRAELLLNLQVLSNSTQATPTPSVEAEHKSNVPTINGSEAGFIGLVVALAAIILICCGLVYYLLRNYPRKGDSSRGVYASTRSKESQGWEQQNNAFDSDSEDDDIEKNHTYRGRVNPPTSVNVLASGQTSSYDDPFDPEKIQASYKKPANSYPPSQLPSHVNDS